MKVAQMLIESPLLKEYLLRKFEENSVEVIASATPMEAIAKMRTFAPDLIILDFNIGRQSMLELLKKKKLDVNTVKTPVVILADAIEQRQLVELAPYNVKNIFTKPIKIDTLFASLSKLLGISFKVDTTKCSLEVSVNENIIFIEIANGFNRDKIDILRYKMDELFFLYRIRIPKVIIMFSDIHLTVAGSLGLHNLLHVVLESSRAAHRNIKIITQDEEINRFIKEQNIYSKIEVTDTLKTALDSLLASEDNDVDKEELAGRIGSQILNAKAEKETDEMSLRFSGEKAEVKLDRDSLKDLRIAVIDDDFIMQELIKNTFEATGATINAFSDGEEFLTILDSWKFDLIFLDLVMPIIGGFEVLKVLGEKKIESPVIILSSISTRDAMIKAIQMGVKSYLVKPISPEDIFKKSIEILKANF